MIQVVIYNRPSDYPDGYLVKTYIVERGNIAPGKILGHSLPSLEAARELVPDGMWRIERLPGDDPVIVEVWV
ncbi:MAG: hypothetical protein EPN91_07915 [Salinibacterium sp.]|nr:MAG: hypothetical protein EPN91_07915 [Salinibacterium sp.]